MFKDARANRAWRLYFFRAEAVLSPLSSRVRRELVADLKAHVSEILAHDEKNGDELARVNAALARMGDPKEFLAPLIADAVFRAPPQQGGLTMTAQTLALYAGRGASYLLRTIGLVLAAGLGGSLALAAFNSLLRPDRAGVFQVGSDEFQVRVLGLTSTGGEQLLAPWMAALLIAAGIAIVAWTARRTRTMLVELIAAA